MRIERIESGKWQYRNLLLLADEQESMIRRYLDRGEMFVIIGDNSEPICSAVVTDEGNSVCELKSLAVNPRHQRKGYGIAMVSFLFDHYKSRFNTMLVGTGDSEQTTSFYKRCGFVYSHTVADFFTDNYDHPIIDNGKVLRDMIYFSFPLTGYKP